MLNIVTYPAPSLSLVCEPVTEITPDVRNLVSDMFQTMYALRGVGLAAPQVGLNLRLLVIDPAPRDAEPMPRAFVNPVLELRGDKFLSEQEGCLSIPLNYRADVERYSGVFLTALDLDGGKIEEEIFGFPAVVLQHEVDHLNGVLFIDRISRLRRTLYDSRLRKWLNRKNTV
jgi:peptide deformylase